MLVLEESKVEKNRRERNAIKQLDVDELNKHKKDIVIKKICGMIGIHSKSFIAGYRGNLNRVSIKVLKKFVELIHEELAL